jgi:lysophospholipase L1-like esterase
MKIAFLGDSITFGYALDDKSLGYAPLTAKMLGAEIENYGITGTLVAKAGLNNTDEKDFVSRAHLIDSADVAVIFGGTNDYFWSDKGIEGDSDEYFRHAVCTLIERAKTVRAGKVTLFVTPYRHHGKGNYEGAPVWNDSSWHDTDAKNYSGNTIFNYVDVIRTECAKAGVLCLDLYDGFEFDWREHTSDGCHPTEKGHLLIANTVVAKLKELI